MIFSRLLNGDDPLIDRRVIPFSFKLEKDGYQRGRVFG
jgi:hypothetical protein